MLAALVRFSIKFYGIIIALAAVILLYGSYRFTHAGLDIFPELSPKQVIIQTEAPGLAAEQVEILVTQAIETAVSGLTRIKSVHSESIQGLSVVTAIFEDDTDIYRNRQLVNERLATLSQMPSGITPIMVPLSSSSATILTIGLSADNTDLMSLRSLVDWTIVPRLLAVPGVADVNVFGGGIKQLQIQVDPVRLQRFNLALDDIVKAAQQAGFIQGSGFIENANQRFTIHVKGQPTTPAQFAKLIVKRVQDHNITLGDACQIAYAPEPAISAAQIMGKHGIVMMVIGQYNANTLTVSRQVEQVLTEFAPIFNQQAIRFYPHLFRPADYIERSLANLSEHLVVGGLFVLAILYVFLFNVRVALISMVAIPVSLTGAVIVLLELGVNLNIMVLGGLAIALGEVVDDAIIDVENIFRRLRENQALKKPLVIGDVIYHASLEVRGSVVYASFIVALVFVPLLTLSGVAGRLFAPLGFSYILAILVSLLVALTLVPALCFAFLHNNMQLVVEPPAIKRLGPQYARLLAYVAQHFKAIAIICIVICMIGFGSFFKLGNQFLPELREGHYIVHTTSLPGTSLQESIRMGSKLAEQFLKVPGVQSVSQWAGRAERGADTYGSHYSEYEVRLDRLSGQGQQQVKDQLRVILSRFPGLLFEVNTFLTERVDETISGYTSPVAVNIYGNDLGNLDQKAQHVANIMRAIPGATDVQIRSPIGTPTIQVDLELDQLGFWGLTPSSVLVSLETAFETHTVGTLNQGNKLIDVAVALEPGLRQQPESIANLTLRTHDNTLLHLDQIADIHHGIGRYNVLHQNAQRRQTVTGNVSGRDLDSFMQELREKVLKGWVLDKTLDIANSHNPQTIGLTYPEFTGAAIEQAQARQSLILHSLLAGVGVLVFIYIAIGYLPHVLLTLANIPFALIGGVLAVLVTGASLSVGSIVGFVTLFGITVRNSIMLTSHYHHLVHVEGKNWDMATVLQGAQERCPSVLMTALVTALAMLPVAFNSDNPGLEIMGPMAAIIVGGLTSSTVLNLLLLPNLLWRYGGKGFVKNHYTTNY